MIKRKTIYVYKIPELSDEVVRGHTIGMCILKCIPPFQSVGAGPGNQSCSLRRA